MSTLSSASTLAQVQAAYDDAASYYEDASVAKAKALVTAGKILIRRLPIESQIGNRHRVRTTVALIKEEVSSAQKFIARRAGNRVKHLSTEDYRT